MVQSTAGTGAAFSTVAGRAEKEAENRPGGALESVLPRTSQPVTAATSVEGGSGGGVGRAMRRVGRWWLQHWLRYAEGTGVQWR